MATNYFATRIRILQFGATINDKLKIALSAVTYFIGRKINLFPITFSNWIIQHTKIKLGNNIIRIPEVALLGTYFNSEKGTQKYFTPEKGDVVIDVGANIGFFTLQSAQAVGTNGFVLAVEANPLNYEFLQTNIALNGYGNVEAYQVAAWNQEVWLDLLLGKNCECHTVKKTFAMAKGRKDRYTQNRIRIKARVLDNLVKDLFFEKVDWVKIDVEGAEFEVLQGLKNTLVSFKPRLIVESYETDRLRSFLEPLGYEVTRIRESGSSPPNNFCIFMGSGSS